MKNADLATPKFARSGSPGRAPNLLGIQRPCSYNAAMRERLSHKCRLLGMLSFLWLVAAAPIFGETALLPEQILVVVNSASDDSMRLGQIYLRLRKVPDANLTTVSVPNTEQITRRAYEEQLAAPVRQTIETLGKRGIRIRCLLTTYGIPLRIGAVRPPAASDEEIQANRERLGHVQVELEAMTEGALSERKAGAGEAQDVGALRAERRRLKATLSRLLGSDTVAAVDSELALVASGPYPIDGWQPNPHCRSGRTSAPNDTKALMISRLDGPTPAHAEALLRMAVEVERNGLTGQVYLDARGLDPAKGAYGRFDADIRKTAQLLQESLIPVNLNNRKELFGPGEAPAAALYCGWYSLAEYRDAFEWARGAVGYHVASAECRSLRDPKRNYWVKRMIEDGVIATLGPVAEPYLQAFPLPSAFFPLLMSGHYTLAEVFAMTSPYLSWRMVLIGDPLYNPYRKRPLYLLLRPLPAP